MSFNHKNKLKCYQKTIRILSNFEPFPGPPVHTYIHTCVQCAALAVSEFAILRFELVAKRSGVGVTGVRVSASADARVRVNARVRASVATGLYWMGNVHIMALTLNSHPNSHIIYVAKRLGLGIRD